MWSFLLTINLCSQTYCILTAAPIIKQPTRPDQSGLRMQHDCVKRTRLYLTGQSFFRLFVTRHSNAPLYIPEGLKSVTSASVIINTHRWRSFEAVIKPQCELIGNFGQTSFLRHFLLQCLKISCVQTLHDVWYYCTWLFALIRVVLSHPRRGTRENTLQCALFTKHCVRN